MFSVLKTCQHAVGSQRNTPKILNWPVKACTQRPHSVHTTFPQRLYGVHDASTAHKMLPQRVHGARTVRTQRAYNVFTAIIAFKIFFFYFFNIFVLKANYDPSLYLENEGDHTGSFGLAFSFFSYCKPKRHNFKEKQQQISDPTDLYLTFFKWLP